MGNLGTYQAMTSLAKKVGGPKALLAATAVAGYVVIRPAEAGLRRITQVAKRRDVPRTTKDLAFRATSDGEDVSGLAVREGDEIRVLECDGDAVLVEVVGNTDNPHFVSRAFLESISALPQTGEGITPSPTPW